MKTLKFAPSLPDLILAGEKNSTWRVNDDKDIKLGDKISLFSNSYGGEFAKAIITFVKVTTFGKLTFEDFDGHEKFSNHEEMLETYSKYYNMKVTNDTELKIIKFKLI